MEQGLSWQLLLKFLSVPLLLFALETSAQDLYTYKGRVKWCNDSTQLASNICVSLVINDSVEQKTLTDENGYFVFPTAVNPNNKIIDVRLSYLDETVSYASLQSNFIDLGDQTFESIYQICADTLIWETRDSLPADYTGTCILYYKDGGVYFQGKLDNGKRDGEWKGYYANGNLHYTFNYKNGRLEGPQFYYYENGSKCSEGTYHNHKMTGKWSFWDEYGNLTTHDYPAAK